LWYENLKKNRARETKSKIKTWSKLKKHMEKRFLPPSYKQELYLKSTILSQENLRVEEYIREFEQLQMRVSSNEDNELTIARFIRGLSLSIAHKVELQSYLSFNDVRHLAIKIEKQLKGRKPFAMPSAHWPQSTLRSFPSYNKGETTPTPIKTIDKGKGITRESPERLEGKKCFKCHGYGHFQADCPNCRTLSIREVEEIEVLEEETSEEEFEEKNHTIVTLDVGELLVIQRAPMPKRFPLDLLKGSKSSTLDVQFGAKCVSLSSMELDLPMWLLWLLMTSYKSPPRCIPPLVLFNGSSKEARQPFLNKLLSLFPLVLIGVRSFVMFFLWMLVMYYLVDVGCMIIMWCMMACQQIFP